MLIIFVMVFQLNVQAAAVPMPILPYMPPNKAELYDLLNNVFGLTRLNIDDDVKRLAAYVDLYTRIMGSANAEIIDRMLDSSYSNRKYVIKAELMNGVQAVMNEQITTGVQEVIQADVTGAEQTYAALMTWNKINSTMLPYSTWESFVTRSNTKFGANNWVVYALYAKYRTNSAYFTIYIGAVNKTWSMSYQANNSASGTGGTWYRTGQQPTANYTSEILYSNYIYSTTAAVNWGQQSNTRIATIGEYYGSNVTDNYTGKGITATRKATAQSTAISTALTNSTDIPVTAASEVNNGVLDTTKDVVISLPAILPVPASNVSDLEDVQDELGVVPLPLTQDVAATVTDLQETKAAELGDTETYSLDLTEYFPFCIPFDIGNLLTLFRAEPEAPTFTFSLPIGYDAVNGFLWETYTLDLSQFDQVAFWCRRGMLLIFIVGLGLSTRQVFLRG